MLNVERDGVIRLTRGDTAYLQVPITNEITNSDYILSPDDVLKFTIKRSVNDTDPLVQKVLYGANLFHIEPTDTKHLSFGKYLYDVELTTSNGDVYTVIVPTTFELMKEIT